MNDSVGAYLKTPKPGRKSMDGEDRRANMWREFCAGAIVSLVGLFVLVVSYGYGLGSAAHIGPGFFPCLVGLSLIGLGAAIFVFREREPVEAPALRIVGEEDTGFDARGFVAIVVGMIAFVVITPHLGLTPGAFVSVFIAALGDRANGLWRSMALAAIVSAAGSAVFGYVLKIGLPYFGS